MECLEDFQNLFILDTRFVCRTRVIHLDELHDKGAPHREAHTGTRAVFLQVLEMNEERADWILLVVLAHEASELGRLRSFFGRLIAGSVGLHRRDDEHDKDEDALQLKWLVFEETLLPLPAEAGSGVERRRDTNEGACNGCSIL